MRLGLTLNEAKTSLKNARQERFDFLGYLFGPHRLQSERSLVSEREPVQEERATVQDEGWQSAGAWQQRSVARSARTAEHVSAWLVELLLPRDAPIGIPQRRPIRPMSACATSSPDGTKWQGVAPHRFSCDIVYGERGLLRLERLPLTAQLCASR